MGQATLGHPFGFTYKENLPERVLGNWRRVVLCPSSLYCEVAAGGEGGWGADAVFVRDVGGKTGKWGYGPVVMVWKAGVLVEGAYDHAMKSG